MSARETLLALAARCEAATDWDMALDVEIAVAITPGLFADGDSVGYTGQGDMRLPLPYTASLDAAQTLVPEGHRWSVDTLSAAGPLAIVDPPRGHYLRGEAATPALALCAAALRARAEALS